MAFYEIRTVIGDVIYVDDKRTLDRLRDALDTSRTITFEGDILYRKEDDAERGKLTLICAAIVSIFEADDQDRFATVVLDA